MKRLSFAACTLAAAAAFTLVSRDAHALGPVDVEAGARVGFGSTPSNFGTGSPNPLGFGLGARAGVDVFGFYGGASFMYYLGGSSNGFSDHSLMEGVDVGYNIKLAILTIRPMVSIGNYTLTGSFAGASQNTSTLYVEPGVTGLVTLGTFFVGADVNALLLTSLPQPNSTSKGLDTAITFHGQVGVSF